MGERDFVFRGKGSVLQDEKLLGVRCTAVRLGDATDCRSQTVKMINYTPCALTTVCVCVCVFVCLLK